MNPSASRSAEKSSLTNGAKVTANRLRRSNRADEYPVGTIGNDREQRNYVQYLVERYHRARKAEFDFGRNPRTRVNYAAIFTSIERNFGAPIYFVSQTRFDELVKYLQHRIRGTVLGKSNIARGIRNYASREEVATEQIAPS